MYKEKKTTHRDVLSYMISYPWPGNVREIKNAVMYMCASSEGREITPLYLPPFIREYFRKQDDMPVKIEIPPEGISLKKLLFDIEKSCFEKALGLAEGNMARAARLLGLEPAAFRKALRERFGGE